ncbi:MAG TPA: MBL fold metallo-hydrolase, partial [Panacibacter sp.]|nr:MBL fold metallo-hydrolase [Panacibacter sp.]
QKEKVKGSEIVVINALRKEEHLSHFTLQQAVDLANELKVPEAWFTHISHQLGRHEEVNATLPQHIRLAYDGLQISI